MIAINNLNVTRGGSPVLNLPEWNVKPGEHWAVLGPSGCGKTTLLHVIAGLLKPESGVLTVAGEDITKMPAARMDLFRGKNIGIVFQGRCLVGAMTVLENLLLAQYMAGLKRDRARAMDILQSMGIQDKANALPSQLSAGQAQRAAVARAVVNRPKIILADEPTSSLDERNCGAALELLLETARRNGATLIVATHDMRVKPAFHNKLELGAG
ncbi:MAG: ATP-binding cassette domain-containing protein [Nitrospinae bacterium]|nr:ATP-binding cassette domain-containing protein [Nitrospinota bacterium]